ncbi:MAG: GDP-L-fucose synthase [Proteobacteria bacterium]|nr:GDP-L-fucose synthase [Pseudomonadota bacterium]
MKGKKVWVNGHRGMVGQALVRRLGAEDCHILKTTSEELDLRRQADVEAWMEANKPEAVFLCAATVGGILANDTRPAEFIYDNLAIEANVIHAARTIRVGKLLFLGAACMYPSLAPQPMAEESLLSGPVEETNQWYAIAKIAGLKMCQAYRAQYGCDFIAAIPANLYGPGDNFDLQAGHVIGALMRKAHEAKRAGEAAFEVWGSGRPKREFMYVDDLAGALVFLMTRYSDPAPINVGTGEELSIRELAEAVARAVGFAGELSFDAGKPDGMERKRLDNARMDGLGWTPNVSLAEGLARTYEWFLENVADDAA